MTLTPEDFDFAYTPDGHYIGTREWATNLELRGIVPELRNPMDNVCSIGFCEAEQKWYGWSHRAIYGFGIGSKVEKGDCAYVADTPEGLIEGEAELTPVDIMSDAVSIIKCGRGDGGPP